MKKFHHAIQIFLKTQEKLFYDKRYERWLVSKQKLNKYNGIVLVNLQLSNTDFYNTLKRLTKQLKIN